MSTSSATTSKLLTVDSISAIERASIHLVPADEDVLLLDLPTRKLLERFGAGGHEPGSGSATALQGLLSAKLIRTVISLSNDPQHRGRYSKELSSLLEIDVCIDRDIYPALETLFHDDAVQFDKAIKFRQARDKEANSQKKEVLADDARQALRPATEIPIDVATRCSQLADFAAFVFDNGFQPARGDSCVAMEAAVSAIAGCISIVDLNLLSFESDNWTQLIRSKTKALRSKLDDLYLESRRRREVLRAESNKRESYFAKLAEINALEKNKTKVSDSDIEALTIKLHRFIWAYRDVYWKKDAPQNPAEILNPKYALNILKYKVDIVATLGQHVIEGVRAEVAGQIDAREKIIRISSQFPSAIQNFTVAHELGHALLHKQANLHRDRPADGSGLQLARDPKERQANTFAKYYLMPEKLLVSTFENFFLSKRFRIDDGSAFALNRGSPKELRAKCRDKRGLAKLLASVEVYDGIHFNSLAKHFSVSVEAMAIRLEELDLFEY